MANNKVTFTKEMAKDYTILIPMMCPIHFEFLKNILELCNYNVELLSNTGPSVIETGLKYVHNDTCYPALLVIGQMIEALQSGKYDLDKTALIITQTGGGCRASNYIALLRKGLEKAGLSHIPVISFNASGLESQPGFKFTFSMLRKLISGVAYGDLLMDLSNQVKPYEVNKGESMALVDKWIAEISNQFSKGKGISKSQIRKNLIAICKDFNDIKVEITPKVKVGIVGEIYVKYSSLGNNNLEDFLASQDCEVKLPGLMGFVLYCVYNNILDIKYYGGSKIKLLIQKYIYNFMLGYETMIIDVMNQYSNYTAPTSFPGVIKAAKKVINLGTKMGEGWLLTGEMMELCESGYKNIICTQPFGCLPNHIVGKGMVRKIREFEPDSNIVAIDYDPGATSVNQENRIKLMLSIAKEKISQ